MNLGVPPTALKARTGLLTPPGVTAAARVSSAWDRGASYGYGVCGAVVRRDVMWASLSAIPVRCANASGRLPLSCRNLVADPCAPDAGTDGLHGATEREQILAGEVGDEVAADAVDMGRRHPLDLGVAHIGQHQLDASTVPGTGLPCLLYTSDAADDLL